MRVTSPWALTAILKSNIAEVRFVKRSNYPPPTRRMLCTLNWNLLNDMGGRIALKFKPPTQMPAYDYHSKGLVCAYDIFMLDWRMISPETVDVVATIPADPPEVFWEYFEQYLQYMSPQERKWFGNA